MLLGRKSSVQEGIGLPGERMEGNWRQRKTHPTPWFWMTACTMGILLQCPPKLSQVVTQPLIAPIRFDLFGPSAYH